MNPKPTHQNNLHRVSDFITGQLPGETKIQSV